MAHITSAPNGLDAKSELVPIFMTFDLFSLPQFYPQRKERKKETQSNCYQTYYTYRKTVDARGGGMITYGLVLCFLSRSKRSRNPIRIQSDSTFVCVSVSFSFLFLFLSFIHSPLASFPFPLGLKKNI